MKEEAKDKPGACSEGVVLEGGDQEGGLPAENDRLLLEGDAVGSVGEALCVECEDQVAALYCERCEENFCDPCWGSQHSHGKRKEHKVSRLAAAEPSTTSKVAQRLAQEVGVGDLTLDAREDGEDDDEGNGEGEGEPAETPGGPEEATSTVLDGAAASGVGASSSGGQHDSAWAARCRFIPLRLTEDERHMLRLVEGSLSVSEYTDNVDVISYANKAHRIKEELQEVCALLTGLQLACGWASGKKRGRGVATDAQGGQGSRGANAAFFQVRPRRSCPALT